MTGDELIARLSALSAEDRQKTVVVRGGDNADYDNANAVHVTMMSELSSTWLKFGLADEPVIAIDPFD